jgi:hypothetical protein
MVDSLGGSSCLSMSFNASRKRLSVSPIISTMNFYKNPNIPIVNSPLVTAASATTTSSITTTTTTTTNTHLAVTNSAQAIMTAQHNLLPHLLQRNFSPMAALSRSPSCSSSPAVINTLKRTQILQSNLTSSAALNQNRSNLTVNNNNNNNATLMTPLIEVTAQQHQNTVFKTPMNNNYNHTPMNQYYRRHFTPHLSTGAANSTISNLAPPMVSSDLTMTMTDMNYVEPAYEYTPPEYCMNLVWQEPIVVAGDCTFNESATKFFYINDLYNQTFICYLMPSKSQLRCLKIDYSYEMDLATLPASSSTSSLSYIPARDACFIESRSLMIVIDNIGGLFVYSGMNKLCKLQLHNIQWSSLSGCGVGLSTGPAFNILPLNNVGSMSKKIDFQSPIVTPIKSKLFGSGGGVLTGTGGCNQSGVENLMQQDESLMAGSGSGAAATSSLGVGSGGGSVGVSQQMFKTPKQAVTQRYRPTEPLFFNIFEKTLFI